MINKDSFSMEHIESIGHSKYGKLSFIRKYDAEAYAYVVETTRLLEN